MLVSVFNFQNGGAPRPGALVSAWYSQRMNFEGETWQCSADFIGLVRTGTQNFGNLQVASTALLLNAAGMHHELRA